jgi:hypothetical protein
VSCTLAPVLHLQIFPLTAPYVNKPEYVLAQQYANDIADLLAPQSGAYYDVWLDGEKFVSVYKEVRKGVQQQWGSGWVGLGWAGRLQASNGAAVAQEWGRSGRQRLVVAGLLGRQITGSAGRKAAGSGGGRGPCSSRRLVVLAAAGSSAKMQQ